MDNEEAESHYLQADTVEERSFDEMAIGFAGGTTSREQVLKWLGGTLLGGGLLGLVPGIAGAKANQSSGASAGDGGAGRDGRRGKHRKGRDGRLRSKRHKGGGSGVCPPTCPRGSVTVAPAAQEGCRCVAISPGLNDPEFACGGRMNQNGDACCFCLFTVEGEGFCAVNTSCDVIAASFLTDCTSSDDCASGWKCVYSDPVLVEPRPSGGFCWPECHTTNGVSEVHPAP